MEKVFKNVGDAIALGAEMKGSFVVVKAGKAVGAEVFDALTDYDEFEKYKSRLRFVIQKHDVRPTVVLCDMHPSYITTKFAEELSDEYGAELVKVQHHIAHAYSVAHEHGLSGFGAIVCDGLGFGLDGNIWGGEVFINDTRVGHLEEHFQLGGDSAAEKPAKMLLSILTQFMTAEGRKKHVSRFFKDEEIELFDKQMDERYNCPLTSSCGRVLDAASVFLGFCTEREYDGSPAIILEKMSGDSYEIEPAIENDVVNTSLLFRYLVLNLDKDKRRLAGTVQQYLVDGLYRISKDHAQGLPIVFSGGCAVNKRMKSFLAERGLLFNKEISCGDQGIAWGQVAYYAKKMRT